MLLAQDWVFLVGNFLLALSLWPTVSNAKSSEAIPFTTSGTAASVLLVFAFTFLSLGLIATAISMLVTAVLWASIAKDRIKNRRAVAYLWRKARVKSWLQKPWHSKVWFYLT